MTTGELERTPNLCILYYWNNACVTFESNFLKNRHRLYRIRKGEKNTRETHSTFTALRLCDCAHIFGPFCFWKMFQKLVFAYYHNTHTAPVLREIFSGITCSRHVCTTAVYAWSALLWWPAVARALDNNNTINPFVRGKLIKNSPTAKAVQRGGATRPFYPIGPIVGLFFRGPL
jgi:hypothetical protein